MGVIINFPPPGANIGALTIYGVSRSVSGAYDGDRKLLPFSTLPLRLVLLCWYLGEGP